MKRQTELESTEGTVVVRRRALGDVVLVGAITARLPPPVTLVTDPAYAEIGARLAGVSAVVPYGQRIGAAATVVDLQGSPRSRIAFPRASRIRKHPIARRIRCTRRGWRGWGHGRPPVVVLYARAAGVAPAPPPWIALPEAPRDALVLVPGASTALKAPRTEILVAVGDRWPGPVVVVGGPSDREAVGAVGAQLPHSEVVVERGFTRTLDHLARARVVVGGDTGLLHLAAAAAIPTVVLAGPTHPDDGFLRWPTGRVVQLPLSCRPCTLHRGTTCWRGDRACMDPPLDDLWRAVEAAGALGAAHR